MSLRGFDPVKPTPGDTATALEASQRLTGLLQEERDVKVKIIEEGMTDAVISIPGAAMRLLHKVLTEMSRGNTVTITPIHSELSTQQAADLLNVSRPYFIQLLEQGALPYRKVGTHRRVLFEDVVRYREEIKEKRRKVLEELVAEAQELDMGY